MKESLKREIQQNLIKIEQKFWVQSLCAKCYVFGFESELSRQSHNTYHITVLLQTSERKTGKNNFVLEANGNDCYT